MRPKSARSEVLIRFSQFLLMLTFSLVLSTKAYSQVSKQIEPGLTAELQHGTSIFVTASPTEDFDISDWADRLLANPERWTKFLKGDSLRVPFSELAQEYQREVIETLFVDDSQTEENWIHKVAYISSRKEGGETLWSISRWFTGNPRNYDKILAYNKMPSNGRLYKGNIVKIPLSLLSPAFKEPILLEISARLAAEASSAESKRLNGNLTLKTDSRGPYASYRMKRGDTIYSKVVMNFTDRVTAEDVMEAAKIICARSGIKDPRRLKARDEVKIPLDLLSPMYLPPDDPRRKEYERLKAEAEQYSNPVRTADLMGIIVIIDPGHGGNDPGKIGKAGKNEIYEDELAYDIMCRIKHLLEKTTMAKVIPTLVDKNQRYEVRDVTVFPNDTDEYVLTNPEYRNHDAKVSANLRWYLANSIFRKVTAEGANADKVVFVSLHADSLHPAARGAMVYIPGTYLCRGDGGKTGYVYTSRAEVREDQYVRISYKKRVRSEGLSGELAEYLVDSLARYGIKSHTGKPIRNQVIKRRHAYVPAVIRHNIVPTKILVEVANLNNPEDCKLATDPDFREKFAKAFVHALKQYYGDK